MTTRRTFLKTAAASGATLYIPFAARADGHTAHQFDTPGGMVTVHPISHASFVMDTPIGTIFVDPVGGPALYADFNAPDFILVTHEHGDHYDAETLAAYASGAQMVTNPNVLDLLPDDLKTGVIALANGDTTQIGGADLAAIPAYNTTEGRENFHPQGRDNGYVLSLDGFRIYISGDTEDVPEMRALENIDIAFVCMNLPFTMDAEAAASAVNEFAPTYCYPYHYRGRDNGTQDPQDFADMLNGVEAKMGGWYG